MLFYCCSDRCVSPELGTCFCCNEKERLNEVFNPCEVIIGLMWHDHSCHEPSWASPAPQELGYGPTTTGAKQDFVSSVGHQAVLFISSDLYCLGLGQSLAPPCRCLLSLACFWPQCFRKRLFSGLMRAESFERRVLMMTVCVWTENWGALGVRFHFVSFLLCGKVGRRKRRRRGRGISAKVGSRLRLTKPDRGILREYETKSK